MPLPTISGSTFADIKAKLHHQRPTGGKINYIWKEENPDRHVSDENDQLVQIAYKIVTLTCVYNADANLIAMVYTDRVSGVKFSITEYGRTAAGDYEFRFDSEEPRGCGHGMIAINDHSGIGCGEGPVELIVELLVAAVCRER